MINSKIPSEIEIQVWEKYENAKNKRDLLWRKLNNDFTLIQKGHEIDEFKNEWNEFGIAELECRNAFDNLQTIAKIKPTL